MSAPAVRRSTRALVVALVTLAAAGCTGAVDVRQVAAESRTPSVARRVALPDGARAVAAWSAPEGGGVVALADGSWVALDAAGNVSRVDRAPGETPGDGEAPVAQIVSRAGGGAVALAPRAALLVGGGLVRRAELPALLAAPRAYAPFGASAVWATSAGLFTGEGAQWLALERAQGPVTDATALAGLVGAPGGSEAWVLAGGAVRRVRLERAAQPAVQWFDATAGLAQLGRARALAAMDGARAAIAADGGVAVVSSTSARLFRPASPEWGAPSALGAGGGWAWVVWHGALLRTDGERWESLVRDSALADGASVAVDGSTGAAALVIDAAGRVLQVEAEPTLRLSGLGNGDVVTDTLIDLEVPSSAARGVTRVEYALDGRAVASRTEAPWGWGEDGSHQPDGSRQRDVSFAGSPQPAFGAHTIDVTATLDGATLRRTVRFQYASPLGRTPSFAADIAPLVSAHCARCHTTMIAHPLATLDQFRAQAPLVRSVLHDRRMPPDVLLDGPSVELFTAWIDANSPP